MVSRRDETHERLDAAAMMIYRSSGIGAYGAVLRWAGMPLEKMAIIMNSSQVSGANGDMARLALAARLTFQDGPLTPFRVVGRASLIAWTLQYSVMGFVFMICDATLSKAMGIPRVVYGEELMMPPGVRAGDSGSSDGSDVRRNPSTLGTGGSDAYGGASGAALGAIKLGLAPLLAGSIESVVANRAEAQRYYGIEKLAKIETSLNWDAVRRLCGPGYKANAARNTIMSTTSFILTPVCYKQFYPQEKKSKATLFWFGLGMNIFVGNVVAITQQAVWGRALDYGAVGGGRPIVYSEVVREGLRTEGVAAFFTPAKWFTRVLMNAPVQGTLPFFYNSVLPRFEGPVHRAVDALAPLVSSKP